MTTATGGSRNSTRARDLTILNTLPDDCTVWIMHNDGNDYRITGAAFKNILVTQGGSTFASNEALAQTNINVSQLSQTVGNFWYQYSTGIKKIDIARVIDLTALASHSLSDLMDGLKCFNDSTAGYIKATIIESSGAGTTVPIIESSWTDCNGNAQTETKTLSNAQGSTTLFAAVHTLGRIYFQVTQASTKDVCRLLVTVRFYTDSLDI